MPCPERIRVLLTGGLMCDTAMLAELAPRLAQTSTTRMESVRR